MMGETEKVMGKEMDNAAYKPTTKLAANTVTIQTMG